MTKARFDVVVIGGGPAGSTAATLLARAGASVLVVERARFPRFHVGESLNPYCLRFFDKLGVLAQVRAQGYQLKRGAIIGRGGNRARFLFSNGDTPEGFREAVQVDRASLDSILLENARRSGALVIEARASRIAPMSEGVRVELFANGSAKTVDARVLVDATGRARLVAKQTQTTANERPIPTVAYYAHASGLSADPYDPDVEEFFRAEIGQGCWFWFIPLGSGRTSVGVVIDAPPRVVERMASREVFRRYWQGSRYCVARSRNMQLMTPVHRQAHMSYNATTYVHGRTFLIGDAAFFADPILSTGFYTALLSAESAAERTMAYLGGAGENAFVGHQRFMERHHRCLSDVIETLYRILRSPALVRAVLFAWKIGGGRVGVLGKYQDFANGMYTKHEYSLRRWMSIVCAAARIAGSRPLTTSGGRQNLRSWT